MNIYDNLWEILRDTVCFSCCIKTWDCFVGELLWFHVSFWLCLLQSALRFTSFQTMSLPLKISSFLSNLLPLIRYELEDKQSKLEQEKKILLSCGGTGCLGVKNRSVISFYVNSAGIFFTLPGAVLALLVGAFASLNSALCPSTALIISHHRLTMPCIAWPVLFWSLFISITYRNAWQVFNHVFWSYK